MTAKKCAANRLLLHYCRNCLFNDENITLLESAADGDRAAIEISRLEYARVSVCVWRVLARA